MNVHLLWYPKMLFICIEAYFIALYQCIAWELLLPLYDDIYIWLFDLYMPVLYLMFRVGLCLILVKSDLLSLNSFLHNVLDSLVIADLLSLWFLFFYSLFCLLASSNSFSAGIIWVNQSESFLLHKTNDSDLKLALNLLLHLLVFACTRM